MKHIRKFNENVEDDEDDLFDGYIPLQSREEVVQSIFNKMSDWAEDDYGNKTNPNFETWAKSLTDDEIDDLYELLMRNNK